MKSFESEICATRMNFSLTYFSFCSFERELKNKLSEKTRGAQSEEQVLLKAFKYFDLNDNGVVEPDEFAKAIEKIGIQIPTRQVSLFKFIGDIRFNLSTCLAALLAQSTLQTQRYLPASAAFAPFLVLRHAGIFVCRI